MVVVSSKGVQYRMKQILSMAKHWKLKWAIQKTMSVTPWPHELNFLFQRYVTRGVVFNQQRFEARLGRIRKHLDAVRRYGPRSLDGFTALELGTGWVPAVSIGLALGGAARVTSVDIEDHLKAEAVAEVLDWFVRYARDQRLETWLGPLDPSVGKRLERASRLANQSRATDALNSLGVFAVVSDIREFQPPTHPTPARSRQDGYDLVVSDNSLEHVPAEDLPGVLGAFRRLVADDGVTSQLIDLGDHYSYFDRRITPYNFFRYSDDDWARYNTSLIFQNRLRVSDFQRLFKEAGFKIVARDDDRRHAHRLAEVPLADLFRTYSNEDLEVTASRFTLSLTPHDG